MQERRSSPRTRVLKAAQLIDDQHCLVVDCTVHDLSIGGACLQVPNPVGLPETFDLSFDSFRSVRRCRAVWRTESRVGVSFG